MGVRMSCNTKHVAALNLQQHLCSFLFEQQHGELSKASATDVKRLEMAQKALANIIKQGIKKNV